MSPSTRARVRTLRETAADVLGDLAFFVADDAPVAPPADATWFHCQVAYGGPHCGTISCWCTHGFANRLAQDLLGSQSANGCAEDALREFMNIVCGQLVTAWHGHESVFNLTIPVVSRVVQPRLPETADRFCIGGEPLFIAHAAR